MTLIEVYRDDAGTIHYEYRQKGTPRTRLTPCGLNTKGLSRSAWFEPGDSRNGVFFERACPTCAETLEV